MTGAMESVLNVMRGDRARIWTASQVGAELKLPTQTVSGRLRQLAGEDKIERVSAGHYRLHTLKGTAQPADEHVVSPEGGRVSEGATVIVSTSHAARNLADFSALQQPAAVQDLPPLRGDSTPVSELEIEQLLSCLKAQGRPMSESMLMSRLSRSGWRMGRLKAVLDVAMEQGSVFQPDGQRYDRA
ncbi:hypothetical protein [Deinococcus sp. QL22]|uniref:hypothetical protein n=1 Tax=Deinococcus sp. QL22 TaxID=2939437 RepID=UPI0020173F2C|nr:hypothetical protein [Deinococcus sp. QL22]UQN08257.1 hypothetical protein M1R55_16070 [Deinococcus sp. QL22]